MCVVTNTKVPDNEAEDIEGEYGNVCQKEPESLCYLRVGEGDPDAQGQDASVAVAGQLCPASRS